MIYSKISIPQTVMGNKNLFKLLTMGTIMVQITKISLYIYVHTCMDDIMNLFLICKQDSVAQQLQKDLNFTRDMGKIYNAMEDQLQELNVKRQAYHSNSFVGNHVNTCLKVQVQTKTKMGRVLYFLNFV